MKGRLSRVDLSQTECMDDTTLKFRFTVPSAVPLLNFGNPAALIFNKEWFLAGGEEAMFQDVSVGTGPFMWEEGQKLGVDEQHFEKNPDYYIPGLPYVDKVVISASWTSRPNRRPCCPTRPTGTGCGTSANTIPM